MKSAAWMVAGSFASWLAGAMLLHDRQRALAAFFGMAGPLLMTVISWLLAERTFTRHPERLTGVMATGFVTKMVFVAAYVAMVVKLAGVSVVPFAISFTTFFIGLYTFEAICLHRLFAGGRSNG